MTEEWLPIPGLPDYLVSSVGRVASLKKSSQPRLMRPCTDTSGYARVTLVAPGGRPVYRRVHCLVAAAFHGPRPSNADVRHLDGDPGNNAYTNLAYGSRLENAADQRRHGTHANSQKARCNSGHLFDEKNTRINKRGGRDCRACQRARYAARKAAA